MDYERQMMKAKCMKQVDDNKNRAAFYVEGLEAALVEAKIRYQREIELLTMEINDYESAAFNNEVKNDDIDRFLKAQTASDCETLAEAQEKIFEAVKFIKKLRSNLETVKRELKAEQSLRILTEKLKEQAVA